MEEAIAVILEAPDTEQADAAVQRLIEIGPAALPKVAAAVGSSEAALQDNLRLGQEAAAMRRSERESDVVLAQRQHLRLALALLRDVQAGKIRDAVDNQVDRIFRRVFNGALGDDEVDGAVQELKAIGPPAEPAIARNCKHLRQLGLRAGALAPLYARAHSKLAGIATNRESDRLREERVRREQDAGARALRDTGIRIVIFGAIGLLLLGGWRTVQRRRRALSARAEPPRPDL